MSGGSCPSLLSASLFTRHGPPVSFPRVGVSSGRPRGQGDVRGSSVHRVSSGAGPTVDTRPLLVTRCRGRAVGHGSGFPGGRGRGVAPSTAGERTVSGAEVGFRARGPSSPAPRMWPDGSGASTAATRSGGLRGVAGGRSGSGGGGRGGSGAGGGSGTGLSRGASGSDDPGTGRGLGGATGFAAARGKTASSCSASLAGTPRASTSPAGPHPAVATEPVRASARGPRPAPGSARAPARPRRTRTTHTGVGRGRRRSGGWRARRPLSIGSSSSAARTPRRRGSTGAGSGAGDGGSRGAGRRRPGATGGRRRRGARRFSRLAVGPSRAGAGPSPGGAGLGRDRSRDGPRGGGSRAGRTDTRAGGGPASDSSRCAATACSRTGRPGCRGRGAGDGVGCGARRRRCPSGPARGPTGAARAGPPRRLYSCTGCRTRRAKGGAGTVTPRGAGSCGAGPGAARSGRCGTRSGSSSGGGSG